MVQVIRDLWSGGFPLARAFWDYAVIYGLLLNLVSHLVFLALILNDADTILIALAFALPIPYNILVVVAVWRSAARYPGPRKWAELARIATVIWMAALTLA